MAMSEMSHVPYGLGFNGRATNESESRFVHARRFEHLSAFLREPAPGTPILQPTSQRAQYPLIKEYTLIYIGILNMI